MSTLHRLPQQATPFVGRVEELAEITRLLADPACRLLTLVGPGGIGKTRLAIEAGQQCISTVKSSPVAWEAAMRGGDYPFSDGIFFVPLQPISDTGLLVPTIVGSMSIGLFGQDEPRQQLLDYLSARQTLLILDNFEQLISGVDLLVDLLKAAPGVRLLVTSREALNVQDEWLYPVLGLAFPGSEQIDDAAHYSAVQLFTERARRVRHDFTLAADQTAVIRICQHVEGMPLALEMAASWTKTLSCADIAAEIQRGLDILASSLRDFPERHRSMQAVFAHSWDMLAEEERAVFRRLTVFRGGFLREAAEQVAGASLWILSALVDKTFLRVDGRGRYDIQELLRQYGQAQLEAAGETNAVRDAHSAYYLRYVAEREADVKGRRQKAGLDEIEADFENVRAAWYRAVEREDEAGINAALEALFRFCDMRCRYADFRDMCMYAEEQYAPQHGEKPRLVWGRCLARRADNHIPTFFSPEGNQESRSLFERALAVAQLHEDQGEVAFCRRGLGFMLLLDKGPQAFRNHPEALRLFEASWANYRDLNDRYYLSELPIYVGLYFRTVGQPERTIQHLRQGLHLKLELGEQHGAAVALGESGWQRAMLGDHAEAEQCYYQALRLMEDIGGLSAVRFAIIPLANLARDRGDFEAARQWTERALKITSDAHLPQDTLSTLNNIGMLHCLADENYEAARRIADQVEGGGSPTTAWLRSLIECGSANYSAARRNLRPILGLIIHRRDLHLMAHSLIPAAIIRAHQGDQERAVELLGRAFTHPAALTGWMEKWALVTRLRSQLQADLGAETYTAAWERGATLDLEAVVAGLIEAWGEPSAEPGAVQAWGEPLTKRELEILRLLADGLSNREIADQRVLAVSTVKWYVNQIFGKLHVSSRTQAVARARALGLLS